MPPPAAARATPAASPSPTPGSAASVAAQFKNAPFLSDLLSVLNHPATAGTPDLKHFRLDSAIVARQRAQAIAATRAAKSGRDALTLAFIAGWVVTVSVMVGLFRWRGALHGWARRTGLMLLPATVVAMSSGLHAAPAPTHPHVAAPVVSATAVAPPSPAPQVAMAPAWQELVSVENRLAQTQDTLVTQEAQIRALASAPAATDPTPAPSAVPGSLEASAGTSSYRADFETPAQRRIARLLDAYERAAAEYQDTLRREYDIYRGAAQDPARKQQIIAAAAASPRPEVKDAVTYNLTLVQAQIDQEAAINAAEAKLQAIGSLSGAQLNAIRLHQAFIIPVEAPVIQGFGPTDFGLEPAITYHGTFYPHFHTGIDIVGPENTPVHAAADGVVLLANPSQDGQGHYTGYGNYVVIAHPDGFVTLYGHLNAFAVKAGDVVHQGQIIGQEGSTGMSTGPHVHFEIRHNGDWVDPMPYLTGQAST